MATIPVVDCGEGIAAKEEEIFNALVDEGFVYLKNCGIETSKVTAAFDLCKEFCSLDEGIRAKYKRNGDVANNGYVGIGIECLQGRGISDVKELYNVSPYESKEAFYPQELPHFKSIALSLMNNCFPVIKDILSLLSARFNDNNKAMLRGHAGTFENNGATNGTTLRMLHYPPIQQGMSEDEKMMRCGEHADYGSLTLLFQDEVGGLEVQKRDGEFVPVTPVEGAVLLNTGSLMAMWTSNRIQAVRHRVRIPTVDEKTNKDRYAIACFIHPDDEFMISPLDGSNSYPSITAGGFMNSKFATSY